MTLEVKNKFIENLLKKSGKGIDDCHHEGLGFRYGSGLDTTHHACYSSFDGVGRHAGNIPFWFHPCAAGEQWNVSITDRAEYAFHAITHPESPWQPFLAAMPEQFEGYTTPEEQAELIARVGLVFGPTAWETLNKVEIGCFAVFHRVAYEHKGVRQSLKTFLKDEQTAALPLRWNVFAAHHLRSEGKNKAYTECWGNWHNNFNPYSIPNSAICYIKTSYTPTPAKSFKNSATGTLTSFMSGNSDNLFVDPKVKGPIKWPAQDSDKYNDSFEEKPAFKDVVSTNLWYWKNKVAKYV